MRIRSDVLWVVLGAVTVFLIANHRDKQFAVLQEQADENLGKPRPFEKLLPLGTYSVVDKLDGKVMLFTWYVPQGQTYILVSNIPATADTSGRVFSLRRIQ